MPLRVVDPGLFEHSDSVLGIDLLPDELRLLASFGTIEAETLGAALRIPHVQRESAFRALVTFRSVSVFLKRR